MGRLMIRRKRRYILSIFIVFLLWGFIYAIINEPLIFPTPVETFKALIEIITKETTTILASLLRLLIIVFISTLLGVILGFLASQKKWLKHYFEPFVTALRTIPIISVIVIILILVGFSLTPYVVTFIILFPVMYQSTLDAVLGIDSSYIDVLHLDENRWIPSLRYCYLPLVKNQLITALLHSIGLGVKVLVMSEYLSQTPNSIGRSLYMANTNIMYTHVFAWTICLICIVVLIEYLIRKYQQFE
jgi:NitT/TauT family transport system permease protein